MINIRRMSKDELIDLTTEILDTNQFYVKQLTDKNKGLDKLAKDKQKMSEVLDRIEEIVRILYLDVDERATPKTKCYRRNKAEETQNPYIYNKKEGSIRLL